MCVHCVAKHLTDRLTYGGMRVPVVQLNCNAGKLNTVLLVTYHFLKYTALLFYMNL